MGIFLNKNKDGTYRRTWYATVFRNGRKTTQPLRTPLCGRIPVDADGKFSLALRGSRVFEASKAAAQQEFQAILDAAKVVKAEERNSPGYAMREAYRLTTGKEFEIVAIKDLSLRNAQRPRYALTGDAHADKYNRSVMDILENFARWCEGWKHPQTDRKPELLSDIDRELVSAYYEDISAKFSWQTFRKYVFILSSVFRYFMPGEVENPFEKVYEDAYKGRKAPIDKTSVVHEAPSIDQMRRLWELTRRDRRRPFLHRLAVVAACTGMRIGDCCTLTWDKVDMLNLRIATKTSKTGKHIAVPIFDYNPQAPDYHPVLGELRKELEAALAEQDDSRYVIPEAARIYLADPCRINKLGKAAFARALHDEDEPEEAAIVGEDAPRRTPVENIRLIKGTEIKETKKDRLIRTYELHVQGKSYSQIASKIGNTKGVVSEDLAAIEEIIGEKLRPGNPYMGANAKPGLRTLLKKTRTERKQGQRAACLYGWHSCRVFFVVTAIDAGISPDDLRLIVGHSTVRMVMHYYNPEELAAAEKVRRQLVNRKANVESTASTPGDASATLSAAIQAVLSSRELTAEAKNAAVLALTRAAGSNPEQRRLT